MSDTPRTDTAIFGREIDGYGRVEWVHPDFARQLERELAAAQDQVRFLEKGIAEQNQEIEQTCGKVLGYPWFKDDQKNFPSSTEKDGVCVGEHVAETIVMELAKKYTAAQARIQRLVEAGDANEFKINKALHTARSMWGKATKKPGIIASDGTDILYRLQGVLCDVEKAWSAAKEEL